LLNRSESRASLPIACEQCLDPLIELDPEVIVPGHGPLCGIEGAMEMKAYLYASFPAALEAVKTAASVFGEPKATHR
jgi:hypothetical protein